VGKQVLKKFKLGISLRMFLRVGSDWLWTVLVWWMHRPNFLLIKLYKISNLFGGIVEVEEVDNDENSESDGKTYILKNIISDTLVAPSTEFVVRLYRGSISSTISLQATEGKIFSLDFEKEVDCETSEICTQISNALLDASGYFSVKFRFSDPMTAPLIATQLTSS